MAHAVPRIRASNIAEHKELTRTALLDAAFKLFVANGFSGTSLTDVASLASVGRTTLYEYFPNKEELFLALVEDRVPPLLKSAVAGIPPGSPVERVEGVYRAAFLMLGRNIDLAFVLFFVGRELPSDVRDRMWRVLWPANEELARQCALGIESGLFPPGDPELLHQMVADLLVGAVDHVLVLGYSPEVAERVLQARLGFLQHGLGATSPL